MRAIETAAQAMEDSHDEAVSTAAGCARVAFESIDVEALARALAVAEADVYETGPVPIYHQDMARAVKAHLLSGETDG